MIGNRDRLIVIITDKILSSLLSQVQSNRIFNCIKKNSIVNFYCQSYIPVLLPSMGRSAVDLVL